MCKVNKSLITLEMNTIQTRRLLLKMAKRWREVNPFIQPPGEEKGVPGILHQPIHQAYKGFLKLGLTRPLTASTEACAGCNKSYP